MSVEGKDIICGDGGGYGFMTKMAKMKGRGGKYRKTGN